MAPVTDFLSKTPAAKLGLYVQVLNASPGVAIILAVERTPRLCVRDPCCRMEGAIADLCRFFRCRSKPRFNHEHTSFLS
jgi:hypothetical protein